MKFNLKIWRQKNAQAAGKMVDYTIENINADDTKPLLMIQYQLMRILFPRLPQVHPIK